MQASSRGWNRCSDQRAGSPKSELTLGWAFGPEIAGRWVVIEEGENYYERQYER
jgi:hypothetical protein